MTLSIAESRPRVLTIRFDVDAGEAVRALREVRRSLRRWWAVPPWVTFGLMGFLAALYLATGNSLSDLWLLGLAAVMVAGITLAEPLIQRRLFRRRFAATPSLRVPQAYTLSDAGLSITAGPTTASLEWDAFVKATETREFFLLFYNDQCAYYLPKRVVGGAPAESELRALLADHLGSRAQAGR